ncbi:unnamed protein product [Alternaria alternata]
MFDLLTEVQDGCKVPRLTIVDDHVAGTIDLSAQTKDGIHLSDCKMESQGTVVQQDQDTTKDYTIVKFEMSYLQQTMEKFTLQFLVDKAKRGKKRSSPPFESDRTLVLFRELQVRPVPTGYRTLFF